MKIYIKTIITIELMVVIIAIACNELKAQICTTPYKIVVLGASNAWGKGADPIDSAWVYRYAYYLKQIDTNYTVYNLAVRGATTYNAQPSSYIPPANKPYPDKNHKISLLLSNSTQMQSS